MPRKRSSQLYSVTPKSFFRKPQKKRKSGKGIFVYLGTTLALLIIMLGVFTVYMVMNGSTIVSPLPVALGERLQLSSSNSGEAEVKKLLKNHKILYTSVKPAHSDYIITLNAKQQVVITKKKDIGEQISSLQVILPRLTMEGREFRNLDLRFDKPVVTY